MIQRLLTILSFIFALTSCKQNKCDFNAYIQTINFIDKPFTFNSINDLKFPRASIRDCDSIFFGKGFQSIGIIFKNNEQYSVLLESKSKIFLANLNYEGSLIDKIELSEIVKWIADNKWSNKYYKGQGNNEEKWLKQVDGAKFLTDMFSHLSKNTLEFRKTLHSKELTEWLLENKPQVFDEVVDLLRSILLKNSISK